GIEVMKKAVILLSLAFLSQIAFGQSFSISRTGVHLSLPGAGWGLDFPAKDFLVEDAKLDPNGNFISCRAAGNDIIMLCYFEHAPIEGEAAACRNYYMEKSKETPMKVSGLRAYELGEMAVFEYLVEEYQGKQVNQMNVHAYLARNGYCAEVHLSRSNYSTDAYDKLMKVLKEVRASYGIDPMISLQFEFAAMYYTADKYDSAIVEYEKVIDREKELIKYNKYFWYVAYDHLSKLYIRVGHPDRAIEICMRGLKRDKKYPMFYYTIACAYANKGDGNLMLDYIRKAYKYKDNMLLGAILPNPLENESFQEMLKIEEFRKEMEKIVQQ
ncbi:MAG: hypothetical protein AB1746_02555, partial [Candidatus Zixiibacteriota bacterium]